MHKISFRFRVFLCFFASLCVLACSESGWAQSPIPPSFIAVANYSTNQNVYAGDLAHFNTKWWLGGSQLSDPTNQEPMIQNQGYHFLPIFNTGIVAVEQNFFTENGPGACTTTSTGCTPNLPHMTATVQLAYNEIGPGGYYGIGNEEDNVNSDDVAPNVYVIQFQTWVNVIKGIDPTAHIVGPNMEQWSDAATILDPGTSGTAGTWFTEFVQDYIQVYGVKPPLDVLSEHLYNQNHVTDSASDDFTGTEDASMVNDVQSYRNYGNSVGYTAPPIWITEFGFDHKLQVGPQTPEQNVQAAQVIEDLAAAAPSLGLQRIFWFTANSPVIIGDGLDPLYEPTAQSYPAIPMPLSDLGRLVSNLANNQVPLITTTSLPIGNTRASYSQQLYATGGTAPYRWRADGLPKGISLSPNGVLSGTPRGNPDPYTADIDITVTDSAGHTATEALPLQINVLTIRTTSVLNGTNGVPYSQQLVATGGTGSYTWTYLLDPPYDLPGGVGPLPNGLSLSSTGLLSGTPDVSPLYPDAAEFWIDVVVADEAGDTANEILPVLINAPRIPQFAITTMSLPDGTIGQPYSYQLTATGGYIEISHAYTWAYGAQAPPPGLTLSSTGLLSGTPLDTGRTLMDVIVYDDVTNQATKVLSLTIRRSGESHH